jgi:hypothetical protein
MLTPRVRLVEIPGITEDLGSFWKIRAIEVNGISVAVAELARLAQAEPKNFKKIRTALRVAAKDQHCTHERYVKRCQNADHAETYEARAHALNSRMMFFYCEVERAVVCTNGCWKAADHQDKAFKNCAAFKQLYGQHHAPKSTDPKRTR